MPNVKLLLTPYKFHKYDSVQRFFRRNYNPGVFVDLSLDKFRLHWQTGLDFFLNHLKRGLNQGWWRNRSTGRQDYEAVRTIGMYGGVREPSLCIELELVDQNHAEDLIKIASKFGMRYRQMSVHVLFSLREEAAQTIWNQNQQIAAKGTRATVHLAFFNATSPAQRILAETRYSGIDALTIHIIGDHFQYHHPVSKVENAKWENMMRHLDDLPLRKPTETWDAILFAIGRGPECTSRYNQWNVNGVHSTIRSRVVGQKGVNPGYRRKQLPFGNKNPADSIKNVQFFQVQ